MTLPITTQRLRNVSLCSPTTSLWRKPMVDSFGSAGSGWPRSKSELPGGCRSPPDPDWCFALPRDVRASSLLTEGR